MRRFFLIIAALIFAASTIYAQTAETIIDIDGKYVIKTKTPLRDNGIVLGAVEDTFNKMNANISVNNSAQQVTIEKNKVRITLTMGSREANVDGKTVDMGAIAKIVDGKMHVPVVPVSKHLKAYINEVSGEDVVLIVTDFVRCSRNVKKTDRDKMVQEQVDNIIRTVIKPGMDDYQKVMALSKHIESITQYDFKHLCFANHEPYGVFIAGYAICNGYCEAMQMLLNKIGISNKIVHGSIIGYSGSREIHGWNLVTINGESFHLDITSNDAVSREKNEYLFISDEQIERSAPAYIIYNKERYPKCGPYSQKTKQAIQALGKTVASKPDTAIETMELLGELYTDGSGDSKTIGKGGNFLVVPASKIGENDNLVFKKVAKGASPSPRLCGVTPDGKHSRLSLPTSYGSDGVFVSGAAIHKAMKKTLYKEFVVIINGDFSHHYKGRPYFYDRSAKVNLYIQKK